MIIPHKEICCMAFSPVQSPVYGGDVLTIQLGQDQLGQAEGKYFVVFEGSRRRHVVSAQLSAPHCLHAYIPGHDLAENVQVRLVQTVDDSLTPLSHGYFRYEYDSTFYLTKFLTSSVYNDQALESLELIKSDRFDLSNEVLSTLDTRLRRSLMNSDLSKGWHLLGGDSLSDAHCEERETLLHFCARLGLRQVAHFLLEQPGSEDALRLTNRQGELPHQIASRNGFHDLAEMLSGYNIHGMVTTEQDVVEMDNAILRSYGNGTTSLTSFLDAPSLDRTVENEISFLKETEEMIKAQRLIQHRQYNSDWPKSINLPQQTGTSRSMPHLALNQDLDLALERIFQLQKSHSNDIKSFLRTSSLPASDVCGEDGRGSRGTASFDESVDGGTSDGDAIAEDSRMARQAKISGAEDLFSTANSYSVLEYSLAGVRDLAEELFQLQDYQLYKSFLTKDLRKWNLSRHSSSCPSLNDPVQCVRLSPLTEGDHYKSMHDLQNEKSEFSSASAQPEIKPSSTKPLHHEGSIDQGIRICVNGITVDSSEDFPAVTASPVRATQDTGSPTQAKLSHRKDGKEEDTMLVSSGCWLYNQPSVGSNIPFDRKDQLTRVRMLAMTGKSLSLTSLEGELESEEEDFIMSANESQAIPIARLDREDTGSISPADSTGSSPTGRDMLDASSHRKLGGELSSFNAKSLCDLSTSTDLDMTLISDGNMNSLGHTSHHFEDNSNLAVPHSTMTKSLSTPSLPQAAEGDLSQNVRDRPGKHQDDSQLYLTNLPEDFDAQFRRQKEIEEEEEEASSSSKKPEISLKDFLSEEHSPNDSDEKSSKLGRKDDKKRKPGVFSRIQSTYKSKKNKEKEIKNKDRHHFVAISISNSTTCDVCHRPMANKPALKCENCLVSVHEHSCKDQVLQCEKNRYKAIQRDGSFHGPHSPSPNTQAGPTQIPASALLERQSASMSGSSLKPSNSFKDKRSVSAPVKPQAGQLPTPSLAQTHRHSLPTSSMADTISESMESLDAVVPAETSWLDEEPDLQLSVEEPEAWSITVDRKTLKKMGTKDIKRQDTIWELINTEKQYVKRLKIMQKIFTHAMLHDMNFSVDQVDRLFPKLDELVELHSNFLRELLKRQAKNEDRSIDDIGDVLISQFGDHTAEKMKAVYGVFCSKHTEAMQLYKEFIKMDRKFQNFARKCTNLPVCEKRDISDFILGVTVRLSKYPILIEAILKGTKDKKDRENLSQALLLSKDVVQYVDEKVAAYEKLIDIQSKLDSRTTIFKGKKFKKQDLNADNRELLHSGKIGWKSARGRVYDVLAVVLTDLILFLQKNEQKYTFLLQDNKSCVIPLYRLLVREKRDAKDSLGIYMISQNRNTPEMYELVCQSKAEREDWIRILQDAIKLCPPDVEPELWPASNQGAITLSQEEDRRRKDDHANHVKEILERLHQKDEVIKECCDEKNKLMLELLEMSTPKNVPGSRPSSQEIITGTESMEIVQAAMQEASRLTTILQGSGTQLSRSVSSVGEHHSNTFVATPVPKRAETFAGFDSNHDSPKLSTMKQRYIGIGGELGEGRSPSMLSLDQQEGDTSLTDIPEGSPTVNEAGLSETKQATAPPSHHTASPLQHAGHAHLWEEQVSSDRSSDRGSLGELSAASVSSLVPSPSNHEQMTSILNLVHYLNALMNLTAKQNTRVESLRAELAEAKEEIAKLSAEMQQGRRSVYRHDQLEELRNIQENISRERQEWERTKLQDRALLEQERERLDSERRDLEREKSEIRNRKEELKREKAALQHQIDMMKQPDYLLVNHEHGAKEDPANTGLQQRPAVHRRSASADFYNTVVANDVQNLENFVPGDGRGLGRQTRFSVGSASLSASTKQLRQPDLNPAASLGVSAKQLRLPDHLLSARNEQRIGSANVQQLPRKLAESSQHHGMSSSSLGAGGQQTHPVRAGSTSINRTQSISTPSSAALAQQLEKNSRTPSNLALVMKLADPKAKPGPAGHPLPPSNKPPAPQPTGLPMAKGGAGSDGTFYC
ncbi:A-kinase anchor protein 13-like isoform X4 [Physella acuta]|uniref:A-kinase anchor protein 13-like isoform X4 n=1 Tax=Physella acuta TaxID=109671 RepID=UPI0027DDAFF7|nr:A-kinase anchor protein 13-like isoform X4 [Physella acuta]